MYFVVPSVFFCLCCFFSRLLFVIIFVFVDSGPFCIYLLSKIHNTAHLRDCVGAIVIYVPAIVICFRPQNPGCRDVYKKKIYGQIEKATEKRACAPHTPTDQQQSALKWLHAWFWFWRFFFVYVHVWRPWRGLDNAKMFFYYTRIIIVFNLF